MCACVGLKSVLNDRLAMCVCVCVCGYCTVSCREEWVQMWKNLSSLGMQFMAARVPWFFIHCAKWWSWNDITSTKCYIKMWYVHAHTNTLQVLKRIFYFKFWAFNVSFAYIQQHQQTKAKLSLDGKRIRTINKNDYNYIFWPYLPL